jgi:hypothetical protein
LPAVGGSDCHTVDHVERPHTEFFRLLSSLEELVEEIRAGSCRGM